MLDTAVTQPSCFAISDPTFHYYIMSLSDQMRPYTSSDQDQINPETYFSIFLRIYKSNPFLESMNIPDHNITQNYQLYKRTELKVRTIYNY